MVVPSRVPRAVNSDVWTTRRLLTWMTQAFARAGLDSPRLQAEMLLAHVIGCERLRLYMDPERPVSPLERQTLRDLVARALRHEPVQYLVGEAWFFGLPFHVDRRVLVPRPATETIVQEVLQHHRGVHGGANATGAGLLIADVCTGSGCIAVALLKNLSAARVAATDASADALEVARANAVRHGVADRADFLRGDLLAPLHDYPATRGEPSLDYLAANPPYIPDDEWPAVPPNVKDHEPHAALRGGPDGMDLVRPLLKDGPRLVKPGGLLLIEVAESRAEAGRAEMAAHPELRDVRVLPDFEGRPRVLVGVRRDARP